MSAVMPESRRPPLLSVPAWDISDEEISEWKQTPSLRFAAYTAECIRNGKYDNGQEIYPPGSPVYQEIPSETVDQAMELLAARGMTRKSGSAWHAIAPGRLQPSISRAVAVLLARRDDLPPALTAELDSWNHALGVLDTPGDTPPSATAGGQC